MTGWSRVGLVLAAVVALSTSAGCGGALTKDIEVDAVSDPAVQFSKLHGYAWVGAFGIMDDPARLWATKGYDIGAELKFLVDQQLHERGYDESAEPDFLVALVIVQDEKDVQEIQSKRAQGLTEFVTVGQGGILVEFIDPLTEQTMWAAAAVGQTRSDYTKDESKKRLAYAVKQVFKRLP